MDEASGIPQQIYSVSEGFFTEPTSDRYWFCFSNPRRNTGPFYDCFHANRAFWKNKQIDSRTVEDTDKELFQRISTKIQEDKIYGTLDSIVDYKKRLEIFIREFS